MVKKLAVLLCLSVPLQAAAPPLQVSNPGNDAANVSTQTAGLPSKCTTGSLVLLGLYLQSNTITLTSISNTNSYTWHVIGPIVGSNNETWLAWAICGALTDQYFTFNLSGAAYGDPYALEYSGMAAAGSVADCNSSGSSGNSTALTGGSCTPSASNDLIVALGGTMQNSTTYTPLNSFTNEVSAAHSSAGNSDAWIDINSSSCNSQTASMTGSVSGQWSMIMAAFKTSSPTACTSASLPTFTGTRIQGGKVTLQ